MWFKNFVDAESSVFDRILELSRAGEGIKFLRHTTFTSSEISKCDYFELLPQTVVRDSQKEYEATWTHYKSLPVIRNRSKWPIKLLDRLYLRTPRVKPNTIAGYGEWTCEYVIGKRIAEIIASSGLSGGKAIPVYAVGDREPLSDCFQLFSNNILPAVDPDISVIRPGDSDPNVPAKPRRYACMAYRHGELKAALDFNRTAEPWGPWDFPSWVVSRSARELFLKNRARARYLPVFESGSAMHYEYVRKWQSILEKLATNPRHEIWA